jgi:cytochrome c5
VNLRHSLWSVLVLASATAFAAAAQQSSAPKAAQAKDTSAAKPAPESQDEGARVFEQHCSRCHTAPDGFSTRISGTVVRHMRVRASLSAQEEKDLLRFFNP